MALGAKHNTPAHRQARARIIPPAYADPTTRCWRCGRTLAEVREVKPDATWDCGHLPGGGWAAECSPCNRGAGARERNAKSRSIFDW